MHLSKLLSRSTHGARLSGDVQSHYTDRWIKVTRINRRCFVQVENVMSKKYETTWSEENNLILLFFSPPDYRRTEYPWLSHLEQTLPWMPCSSPFLPLFDVWTKTSIIFMAYLRGENLKMSKFINLSTFIHFIFCESNLHFKQRKRQNFLNITKW